LLKRRKYCSYATLCICCPSSSSSSLCCILLFKAHSCINCTPGVILLLFFSTVRFSIPETPLLLHFSSHFMKCTCFVSSTACREGPNDGEDLEIRNVASRSENVGVAEKKKQAAKSTSNCHSQCAVRLLHTGFSDTDGHREKKGRSPLMNESNNSPGSAKGHQPVVTTPPCVDGF
jgi:hypothetical protein